MKYLEGIVFFLIISIFTVIADAEFIIGKIDTISDKPTSGLIFSKPPPANNLISSRHDIKDKTSNIKILTKKKILPILIENTKETEEKNVLDKTTSLEIGKLKDEIRTLMLKVREKQKKSKKKRKKV